MEPENRLVTTAAPAVPTYPTLLLRLWLVRARLKARAGARAFRRHDTADDRRLAAVLVAAGTAVITLLVCAASGFKATTCGVLTAVGFFAPLGVGLALLFGPDDYDCEAELAEVTGLLPEAKRVWDQRRAAARTARKQGASTRVNARGERGAANPAETEGLVEHGNGGPPPVPELEGDGTYAVPVLGEVHVGRILADVCQDELPPVGQDKVVSVVVRIENTNRDSRAVSVEIAGRRVGHLSRADAQELRRLAGTDIGPFTCRAVIHAGWKHGRVHYDLRLDVNLGSDRTSGDVNL
jgi:hypothetical protein